MHALTDRVSSVVTLYKKSCTSSTYYQPRQLFSPLPHARTHLPKKRLPTLHPHLIIQRDPLILIPPRPLHITRVPVHPPHILPDLRFQCIEEPGVDRVQGVGEDELRPGEDAELIAEGVEVVDAAGDEGGRGLVGAAAPDAELGGSRVSPTKSNTNKGNREVKGAKDWVYACPLTILCPVNFALSNSHRIPSVRIRG